MPKAGKAAKSTSLVRGAPAKPQDQQNTATGAASPVAPKPKVVKNATPDAKQIETEESAAGSVDTDKPKDQQNPVIINPTYSKEVTPRAVESVVVNKADQKPSAPTAGSRQSEDAKAPVASGSVDKKPAGPTESKTTQSQQDEVESLEPSPEENKAAKAYLDDFLKKLQVVTKAIREKLNNGEENLALTIQKIKNKHDLLLAMLARFYEQEKAFGQEPVRISPIYDPGLFKVAYEAKIKEKRSDLNIHAVVDLFAYQLTQCDIEFKHAKQREREEFEIGFLEDKIAYLEYELREKKNQIVDLEGQLQAANAELASEVSEIKAAAKGRRAEMSAHMSKAPKTSTGACSSGKG